jgi:hypothetical protein
MQKKPSSHFPHRNSNISPGKQRNGNSITSATFCSQLRTTTYDRIMKYVSNPAVFDHINEKLRSF